MNTIEKKDYGYKLTFADFIKAEEMKKWIEESTKELTSSPKEFGFFVDMRTLKPLPADSKTYMEQGQKLYKENGMVRSVVILNSSMTTIQFKKIAKESGIYEWERYIDASTMANWGKIGEDWITNEIDPDLN